MKRPIWVLLFSGLLVTSTSAFCQDTNFSITGGSYSYAGGAAALTGSLTVGTVTGQGTTPGTTLTIEDGELSLTTGAKTGSWQWGGPGSLTVTGCINGVTPTGANCATETLVTETFDSATILSSPVGLDLELGSLAVGSINPLLASYFGVTAATTSGAEGDLIFVTSGSPGGAMTGISLGGNLILNESSAKTTSGGGGSVPEEWNLASTTGLFAFGLVAFWVARRLGVIKAVPF